MPAGTSHRPVGEGLLPLAKGFRHPAKAIERAPKASAVFRGGVAAATTSPENSGAAARLPQPFRRMPGPLRGCHNLSGECRGRCAAAATPPENAATLAPFAKGAPRSGAAALAAHHPAAAKEGASCPRPASPGAPEDHGRCVRSTAAARSLSCAERSPCLAAAAGARAAQERRHPQELACTVHQVARDEERTRQMIDSCLAGERVLPALGPSSSRQVERWTLHQDVCLGKPRRVRRTSRVSDRDKWWQESEAVPAIGKSGSQSALPMPVRQWQEPGLFPAEGPEGRLCPAEPAAAEEKASSLPKRLKGIR